MQLGRGADKNCGSRLRFRTSIKFGRCNRIYHSPGCPGPVPFRYQQNGGGRRKRSEQLSRGRRFVSPIALKLSFHRTSLSLFLRYQSFLVHPVLFGDGLSRALHPPNIKPRISKLNFSACDFRKFWKLWTSWRFSGAIENSLEFDFGRTFRTKGDSLLPWNLVSVSVDSYYLQYIRPTSALPESLKDIMETRVSTFSKLWSRSLDPLHRGIDSPRGEGGWSRDARNCPRHNTIARRVVQERVSPLFVPAGWMMEPRQKGRNLEKYHGREIKRNGWHDSHPPSFRRPLCHPASSIGLIAEIDVPWNACVHVRSWVCGENERNEEMETAMRGWGWKGMATVLRRLKLLE